MELIITSEAPAVNTEAIHKGDLIRAKYSAWNEARNGQVAAVKRDEIRVIWQPSIRNVTNYFSILASEIAEGRWTVTWSPDLETIYTYTPPDDGDNGGGE